MAQGLMIAAPRSGSGKTTVTLGLLRALARQGIAVGSFKCGPDYIDPAFHTVATGRQCFNLDSWAMPASMLDHHMALGLQDADMVIAEGSMGLFDGVATHGASGDGSSADIAARYGLPVVLIVDTSGQSQSAGAVAMGFKDFHPDVAIAGVILGNVASERHTMLAMRGMERAGLPVLGALPRGGVPVLPQRHLGLVQAQELPQLSSMIDALADAMEKYLDMEALLEIAAKITSPPTGGRLGGGRYGGDFPMLRPHNHTSPHPTPPPNGEGIKIALASDVAFSFVYPHILAGWKAAGAEIRPFSPLADEAPDDDADCCWLPGGYPELHAETLAGNGAFMQGLRQFAQNRPVYGECGGYMVLGDSLEDVEGRSWPMAGLLPLTTSFARRKLHLGYRAVRLLSDTPVGAKGALLRGHEFHYASITQAGQAQALGEATDANGAFLGPIGQKKGLVTGSFLHLVAPDS